MNGCTMILLGWHPLMALNLYHSHNSGGDFGDLSGVVYVASTTSASYVTDAIGFSFTFLVNK